MYWSLRQPAGESDSAPHTPNESNENETSLAGEVSNLAVDDSASDTVGSTQDVNEQSSHKSENDEPSRNVENEES